MGGKNAMRLRMSGSIECRSNEIAEDDPRLFTAKELETMSSPCAGIPKDVEDAGYLCAPLHICECVGVMRCRR